MVMSLFTSAFSFLKHFTVFKKQTFLFFSNAINWEFFRTMSWFSEVPVRHFIEYNTSLDLTYSWSFGALAGLCFVFQIVTGVCLAMHYVSDIFLAFDSLEYLARNISDGWLFRYFHANGASFFFIVVYFHIFRNLMFRTYRNAKLAWLTGVLIFLLLIITAFLGYVLPWGQMSFWGATVITSLCTVIPFAGVFIVQWIWGGFSVGGPTLARFYILHAVLPMVLAVIVIFHILFLHKVGSTSPSNLIQQDGVSFYPYFFLKDFFGLCLFLFAYGFFSFYLPNLLGHPDNYIQANPLVTPEHIVPEWYFLPFYAILRAVPHKLGGVLAMLASIIILFFLPKFDNFRIFTSVKASFFFYLNFVFFISSVLVLGWVGGMPAEEPFVFVGRIAGFFYFLYFVNIYLLSLILNLAKMSNVF